VSSGFKTIEDKENTVRVMVAVAVTTVERLKSLTLTRSSFSGKRQ
jgi:hypothetical protein